MVRRLEPFSIVALDPGGTTGIAKAVYKGTELGAQLQVDDFGIWTGEMGPGLHHQELYDFLRSLPIDCIFLSESFEFRQNLQKMKVELISREYIGITRLVAAQRGIEVRQQMPSQAMNFVTDAKLEAMGLLRTPKHPKRHQNDALRHLIYYLIVTLGIRTPLTDRWRSSNG